MIILLSPAKSLDFSAKKTSKQSIPRLLEKSIQLVDVLKKKSSRSIQRLMSVSEKIADLNVERFNSFQLPFDANNAKASMYAFNGDVYLGLEAETFKGKEISFAQKHLRILSGLYGLLKPLDLVQPYRLEMGTKLKVKRKKNLYEFWGNEITETINQDLVNTNSKYVLNLASKEYFHAVKPAIINGEIIHIEFKENRNGTLKIISFNAKKARGRMAHLIVKKGIKKPEGLKKLVVNDYVFDADKSDEHHFLFVKN